MQPNNRAIVGLTFTTNATTEVRIPRGWWENRLFLSGAGTDAISVAATSVRARGTPIQQVQVLSGQTVLHAMRPQDLINEAEVFEQTALAALVTPIPGVGIASHLFTFDLPLLFEEPHSTDPLVTALATWMYEELIFRVQWGGHPELAVGGTGVVTMQTLQLTAMGNQFSAGEAPGDLYAWALGLARSLRGFKETATAAANAALPIEVPRTADIRALVLKTEDANGEPVNTILNTITLTINNQHRQVAQVPARALRANNAKVYGVTMPPGMYILDFAEDKDLSDILEATKFGALDLSLDVAAVTGTIRTWTKRLQPAAVAA